MQERTQKARGEGKDRRDQTTRWKMSKKEAQTRKNENKEN